MNTITIDVSGIVDRPGFHDLMTEALVLPSWYGRNLDALYDCLTEIAEETTIAFTGWEQLQDHMSLYAACAEKVLNIAAQNNPRLTVSYL